MQNSLKFILLALPFVLGGLSLFFQPEKIATPDQPTVLENSWRMYQLQEWRVLTQAQAETSQSYLSAKQVDAFESQQVLQLKTPFALQKQTSGYVHFASQLALLNQQQQTLQLMHSAEISQYPASIKEQTATYRLSGELLEYSMINQQLTSPLAVTIHQPGLTISGKQLTANLDTQDFSLRESVNTLYLPPQP